jgi:hypothetical protein
VGDIFGSGDALGMDGVFEYRLSGILDKTRLRNIDDFEQTPATTWNDRETDMRYAVLKTGGEDDVQLGTFVGLVNRARGDFGVWPLAADHYQPLLTRTRNATMTRSRATRFCVLRIVACGGS